MDAFQSFILCSDDTSLTAKDTTKFVNFQVIFKLYILKKQQKNLLQLLFEDFF